MVADDVTESTYEADVATLLQEMEKRSQVKNVMDKTLPQQRKWKKTELQQVEQILEIFPILKRAHFASQIFTTAMMYTIVTSRHHIVAE